MAASFMGTLGLARIEFITNTINSKKKKLEQNRNNVMFAAVEHLVIPAILSLSHEVESGNCADLISSRHYLDDI